MVIQIADIMKIIQLEIMQAFLNGTIRPIAVCPTSVWFHNFHYKSHDHPIALELKTHIVQPLPEPCLLLLLPGAPGEAVHRRCGIIAGIVPISPTWQHKDSQWYFGLGWCRESASCGRDRWAHIESEIRVQPNSSILDNRIMNEMTTY